MGNGVTAPPGASGAPSISPEASPANAAVSGVGATSTTATSGPVPPPISTGSNQAEQGRAPWAIEAGEAAGQETEGHLGGEGGPLPGTRQEVSAEGQENISRQQVAEGVVKGPPGSLSSQGTQAAGAKGRKGEALMHAASAGTVSAQVDKLQWAMKLLPALARATIAYHESLTNKTAVLRQSQPTLRVQVGGRCLWLEAIAGILQTYLGVQCCYLVADLYVLQVIAACFRCWGLIRYAQRC